MLILNSQSKTICKSTNLNLAWPELGTTQLRDKPGVVGDEGQPEGPPDSAEWFASTIHEEDEGALLLTGYLNLSEKIQNSYLFQTKLEKQAFNIKMSKYKHTIAKDYRF